MFPLQPRRPAIVTLVLVALLLVGGGLVFAASITQYCGNKRLEGTEQCDDGNSKQGDGCYRCKSEKGWDCTTTSNICVPICGDGFKKGSEKCDDENTTNGDGCSNTCKVEMGWSCYGTPSICRNVCGNKKKETSEQCDDGNRNGGDGCSAHCGIEDGWTCTGIPSVCTKPAICGNGTIESPEACDDGGTASYDGCSSNCQIEPGWSCTGQPSTCDVMTTDTCSATPVCGNHILEHGEQCESDIEPMMSQAGNRIESAYCKQCRSFMTKPTNGSMGAGPVILDTFGTYGNNWKPKTDGGFHCGYFETTRKGTVSDQGPEYGDASWNFEVKEYYLGYDVYVTYPASPDYGVVTYTNPSYVNGEGRDGSGMGNMFTYLYNVKVDQRIPPAGLTYLGTKWKKLWRVYVPAGNNVRGGFIQVDLHLGTGSKMTAVADAVMVVPHGYEFPGGFTTCGDGAVGGNEECDDGNLKDGDGCNSACAIETGWLCGAKQATSYCPGINPVVCRTGVKNHSTVCITCPYWDGGVCSLGDQTSFHNVNARTSCAYDGQASVCSQCGNGVIDPGEACDDGNPNDGDGCSSQCQIEGGWQCDSNATPSFCWNCGDGKVEQAWRPAAKPTSPNVLIGEECDTWDNPAGCDTSKGDCNAMNGPGCTPSCKRMSGWQCLIAEDTQKSHCFPVNCGNRRLDPGEQCDNGAPQCGDGTYCVASASYTCGGDGICIPRNGDGCSDQCTVEPGWYCPKDPTKPCMISCGDGVVGPSETCDDGNTNKGDGCSYPKCQVENGWSCKTVSGSKSACKKQRCGNGTIEGVEECDDGNTKAGDGCSAECKIENGYTCTGGEENGYPSICQNCGNGITESGEQCDDANKTNGDGCSNSCTLETGGWQCVTGTNPSTCWKCGDGVMGGNEACDDGNTKNGDGCSADCMSMCADQHNGVDPGKAFGVSPGKGRFEGDDVCQTGTILKYNCQVDSKGHYSLGSNGDACHLPGGCSHGVCIPVGLSRVDWYYLRHTVEVEFSDTLTPSSDNCPVIVDDKGNVLTKPETFCKKADKTVLTVPESSLPVSSGLKVHMCIQRTLNTQYPLCSPYTTVTKVSVQ